jgi:DNA-binding PadR family transcriptional regulator|tara:strand:+ start:1636 stop:1965 length:330 start_codon:yes stop_codon:yes gene_type:complete
MKPSSSSALTEAVFYTLLSLQEPRHGYGIMQFVQELSNDRIQLAPGTLYGALNSLVEKGWICAVKESSGRKKEYIITELGYLTLETEISRLEELVKNGKQWIGEKRHAN